MSSAVSVRTRCISAASTALPAPPHGWDEARARAARHEAALNDDDIHDEREYNNEAEADDDGDADDDDGDDGGDDDDADDGDDYDDDDDDGDDDDDDDDDDDEDAYGDDDNNDDCDKEARAPLQEQLILICDLLRRNQIKYGSL